MQGYWTLVQHAETEYLRDKDPMSSVIISQRFTFTKSVPQGVSGQITASWTPNEIDLNDSDVREQYEIREVSRVASDGSSSIAGIVKKKRRTSVRIVFRPKLPNMGSIIDPQGEYIRFQSSFMLTTVQPGAVSSSRVLSRRPMHE